MSSVIEGKIAIYACGGGGISIASHFEKFRNKEAPNGYGQVVPAYIDTSMGDISDALPRESIFVFEHTDGSGKVRAENNSLIKENTNKILQKFTPGDLNIVISTLSGGSGGPLAGHLTIELLKRKVPTIVIGIASCASRIEVENAVKSIKTYEKAAHITEMPVVLSYWQNDENTPRSVVDNCVIDMISALSALFSRQHKRLDTADLAHWLNISKINNTVTPRLMLLDKLEKSQLLEGERDVLSVATLAKDGQDTSPGVPVEYHAVGFVDERYLSGIHLDSAVHFCVIDGTIPSIFANLEKELSSFNEHRRAKPPSKPVAKFAENDDDDIIV